MEQKQQQYNAMGQLQQQTMNLQQQQNVNVQQQNGAAANNHRNSLRNTLQEVLLEVSDAGPFSTQPSTTVNPLQQNLQLNLSSLNALSGLGGNTGSSAMNLGGLGGRRSFTLTQNAFGGGATAGRSASRSASLIGAIGAQPGMAQAALGSVAAAASSSGPAATSTTPSGINPTQQLRPSEALGMTSEELLLAAATEKRIMEESQRRQALAEKTLESRRLYQQSLLQLMKNQGSVAPVAPTGLAAMANPNGLLQQGLLQQFAPKLPQPVLATAMQPQMAQTESKTAIKVLGTSLRKKDSPYLDVSGLQDPDVSDKRTRGGVTEPFPEKLHRMLEEVQKEGKDDIISFFSHGRAFAVHDPDRFTSEIMPKYFKQSRLSSFQRQLNLYGFTRITSGPDAGGYYHELFLKGRPNLAVHMRRVGLPQGEDRRKMRAKNMRCEPNFYAMGNVKDAKVNIPGLH